jgi:hypothetical protein
MSLLLSDLVSVSLLVSPMPPAARDFGTLFILGDSGRIPSEERTRTYSSLTGVADDFQSTDEEYLAAQVYFGQSPKPKYLKLGEHFATGAAGHLNTGTCNTAAQLAAINAVTSGGMDISVDGTLIKLHGLNFSTDDTFAKVATRLQTAIAAGVASTTCTHDGTKFIITSPTLVTGTVTVGSAPTYDTPPTAIQALLCATVATGAVVCAPLATETITQSLQACWNADPTFYGVALSSDLQATAQNVKDMGAWAQGMGLAGFYTTAESTCLAYNNTSNLGYYFENLGYEHLVGTYSSGYPNAHVSLAARYFAVDFNQPNSTITGMFKQLPGVGADTLTETNKLQLESYNLNFYTTFGSFLMLANGVTASGRYFDEVMGLDWLQSTVQTNVVSELTGAVSKIPQTDGGVAKLVSAITLALKQGVTNGLLAPGVWNGDALGEKSTGAFLADGFYVYAQPVAQQSSVARAARQAPAITAICIGAGAIQGCAITVNFQR